MPPPRVVKLFNAPRLGALVRRLPFFTRCIMLLMIVCAVLEFFVVSLSRWGGLITSEVNLSTMHKLTTFPFFHRGIFGAILNLVALLPLLERFEAEHGTLVSAALFLGPFTTVPAAIFVFVKEYTIFANNASDGYGAGPWIFLLLAGEGIKTYRSHPYLQISTISLPTYLYPVAYLLLVYILLPTFISAPLAHPLLLQILSLSLGYAFALGYTQFLIPPSRILRLVETRLDLLGRLPHYVSIEGTVWGRYGVAPTMMSSLEEGRASFIGGGGVAASAASARGRSPGGGFTGADVARNLFVGAERRGSSPVKGATGAATVAGATAPPFIASTGQPGGVVSSGGAQQGSSNAPVESGVVGGAPSLQGPMQLQAVAGQQQQSPQSPQKQQQAVGLTPTAAAAASASAAETGEKVA